MSYVDEVLAKVKEKNAHEPEFLQAVEEVLNSLRPVIAVATQNSLLEKTVSNIKEVKARGAMTIVICDEEADIDFEAADHFIRIPKISEMLMPMVATIPMQLLAYYTSVNKGNDVDKPRNLAKSVTVE